MWNGFGPVGLDRQGRFQRDDELVDFMERIRMKNNSFAFVGARESSTTNRLFIECIAETISLINHHFRPFLDDFAVFEKQFPFPNKQHSSDTIWSHFVLENLLQAEIVRVPKYMLILAFLLISKFAKDFKK